MGIAAMLKTVAKKKDDSSTAAAVRPEPVTHPELEQAIKHVTSFDDCQIGMLDYSQLWRLVVAARHYVWMLKRTEAAYEVANATLDALCTLEGILGTSNLTEGEREAGRDIARNVIAAARVEGDHLVAVQPPARAMLAALKEIAIGRGPYKIDPMAHAESVIEAMKDVAKEAIAAAEAAGIKAED